MEAGFAFGLDFSPAPKTSFEVVGYGPKDFRVQQRRIADCAVEVIQCFGSFPSRQEARERLASLKEAA